MTSNDSRHLPAPLSGMCWPERLLTRRNAINVGIGFGLAGVFLPAITACRPMQQLESITVAGGEPGGFYLEFATLLAESLKRHGVAQNASPLATEASQDNLQLLLSGEATLGIALADSAAQVMAGSPGRLVALGRVFQNYFHCIVREDSRIRTVEDLAGKSVGTGAAGSGTWLTGQRIIAAAGLDEAGAAPIRERRLGLNMGLTAIRDGSIDALLLSGGVPIAAITAANDDVGLRFIDLSALIPRLRASHGGIYERVLIPKNSYKGTPAVGTVGVANLLLCRDDLDGGTVGQTVELLVRHAQELIPRSSLGVQFLSPESLISTAGLPLHPAAAATYRALRG